MGDYHRSLNAKLFDKVIKHTKPIFLEDKSKMQEVLVKETLARGFDPFGKRCPKFYLDFLLIVEW